MKYTAEELATYVFDEDLQSDLITAIMNLDGYKVLPVTGKVEKTPKGYQYTFDPIGLDLEPYEIQNIDEANLEKMRKHPEDVSACLMLHHEVAEVLIDYCHGTAAEQEYSLWLQVFANMFSVLDIDTKGKLKKYIQNGMQKQLVYNELDKKVTQLFTGK